MNDPQVSVIMPAYRHEAFVGPAAASALEQTYADIELIAIDDASPDGTGAILSQVAAGDPRVRVVRHETNRGLVTNLNQGLAMARGSVVAVIASDDLWHPQKLAHQMRHMSEPSAWCYGRAEVITSDGTLVDNTVWGAKLGRLGMSPFEDLLRANRVPALTLMARRSALLDVGGWSEGSLFEDYDLSMRLAARSDGRFVDEVLAKYRRAPTSLSAVLTATGRDLEALSSCFRNLLSFLEPDDQRREMVRGWMRVRVALESLQVGDVTPATLLKPEDAHRLRTGLADVSAPQALAAWPIWLDALATVSPRLRRAAERCGGGRLPFH